MRAASASMLVLVLVAPFVPFAGAATFQSTAFNGFWTPDALAIDVGDSVEFLLGEGTHNWELADGTQTCELPCTRTFNVEGTVAFRCGIHHSMTGTITVGTPPVVAIATPTPGATVSGVLHVEGSASHATDAIASVSVRIDDGAPIAATLQGAGTSVTWSADVPTATIGNGERLLVARATTSGGVAAQTSIPILVDNVPFVDMVLASASAQQGATTSNVLSFVVRNDGNTGERVTVLAEYLYHEEWRVVGSTLTDIVAPGASVPGSIAWSAVGSPKLGAFSVRFTADPAGALPDPERANNVRATTAGWVTNAIPGIVLLEPL